LLGSREKACCRNLHGGVPVGEQRATVALWFVGYGLCEVAFGTNVVYRRSRPVGERLIGIGVIHQEFTESVQIGELFGVYRDDERTLQMSDLAHQAKSSLSRLSHVISRLENRGWVIKRPCEKDRRASTVILTAAGDEKIRGAAPGHSQLVQELIVQPLSPVQLRDLGQAAATVVQAIATADRARKASDTASPAKVSDT
jgi:DNA-binding MarR family transcriptional regulator